MLRRKYVYDAEKNNKFYPLEMYRTNQRLYCSFETLLDLQEPEVVGVHNHEPSQIDVNVFKSRIEMKTNARNNGDNPARIFSNALEQLGDLTSFNSTFALSFGVQTNNTESKSS